jgi:hypothetical protein
MIVLMQTDPTYPPSPVAGAARYCSAAKALAAARHARGFVLAAPDVEPGLIQLLDSVRRLPAAPWTVVYTTLASGNASALARVQVDHVVWDHEEDGRLIQVIREWSGTSHEQQLLIRAIERSAADLPPTLHAALSVALTTFPPVRTVKRWSLLAGCTPRNLQLLWNSHLGPIVRPHEFIRALASASTGVGDASKVATATLARVRMRLESLNP